MGDKCRDLVKKGESWGEALKVCNEALSDRKSLEEGEEYHVLIARARSIINISADNKQTEEEGNSVLDSLKDLDEAIAMKPALTGPYWIRAEANLKLGDFQSARKDLERFDESPRLSELRRQIDRGEMEMRMAREAVQQKNWRGVSERAASVLKNYSPFLIEAQNLLFQSLFKIKDHPRALKLLKDSRQFGKVKKLILSKLLFATGDFSGSLKLVAAESAKEAEKEKEDSAVLEFIGQIAKKFEEIENLLLRPSIAELEKLMEILKSKYTKENLELFDTEIPDLCAAAEQKISSLLCFKYAKVKQSEKAVEFCKFVMKKDPNGFVDYSLSLAEAHGQLGQHDEAVGVLEEASRKSPRENRIQEALKAAQKARHDAANPDYYTVLGVPRDASEKQIKLAYRRLAQKFHPDKLKNATPEQKRAAELKMGQINRAHDVLGDKEKRAQFDRGVDPENPQGNPFGGHHQQGGFGFNGGAGGANVPFEFIFEAMRQQQQQQHQQARGGHHQHHRQHQQHHQHHQHQQFHFNFKEDL